MLKKFLLGRGINKATEALSKFFRHGLTTAGGGLIVAGHMSADDVTVVGGAVSIVLGVLASLLRTWLSERI